MTPKSQATTNCTSGVLWKAFCLFFFFKHILYMPYDYTLSKLLLFPCYSLDPVVYVRWRIPGLMAFKSVVLLLCTYVCIYAFRCSDLLQRSQESVNTWSLIPECIRGGKFKAVQVAGTIDKLGCFKGIADNVRAEEVVICCGWQSESTLNKSRWRIPFWSRFCGDLFRRKGKKNQVRIWKETPSYE